MVLSIRDIRRVGHCETGIRTVGAVSSLKGRSIAGFSTHYGSEG